MFILFRIFSVGIRIVFTLDSFTNKRAIYLEQRSIQKQKYCCERIRLVLWITNVVLRRSREISKINYENGCYRLVTVASLIVMRHA